MLSYGGGVKLALPWVLRKGGQICLLLNLAKLQQRTSRKKSGPAGLTVKGYRRESESLRSFAFAFSPFRLESSTELR